MRPGYIPGLFSCLCKIFSYFVKYFKVFAKDIYCLLCYSLTDVDSNTKLKLKATVSHKVIMASKWVVFFSPNYVIKLDFVVLGKQWWFQTALQHQLTVQRWWVLAYVSCSEVSSGNIDWAYAYRTGPKMLEDVTARSLKISNHLQQPPREAEFSWSSLLLTIRTNF